MKKQITIIAGLLTLATLSGCAKQSVVKLDIKPQHMCIAKHDAVIKSGVLLTIEDKLKQNGIKTKVVQGTYVQKNNLWQPSINQEDVKGCDAVTFYVANWAWDITTYMRFANIWVMDTAMAKTIGSSTYTAGAGFDKFDDYNIKIGQMVDELVK